MSIHRSRTTTSAAVVAVSLLGGVLLGACDIGDGTTLRDPVAPTTLPPPDTAPLSTLPLDDGLVAGLDDTPLSSLPIDATDQVDADPDPVVDDTVRAETLPIGSPVAGDAQDFRLLTPWADGGSIDVEYTCDGSNAVPTLSWTSVPVGTAELAISLVDESELSNGRPFVHWVLAGLDPTLGSIAQETIPDVALRGLNFFGEVGYTGPCPPLGDTNTYTVTLYAMSQQLELSDGTPAAEMLDVIETIAFASSSVSATVTR